VVWKAVLDCNEHTNSHLHGNTTDHASSNYLITGALQAAFEPSGSELPAFRNHIPCMGHDIQLGEDAFMSSLDAKGHIKCWEADGHDQQFGQNESIDIGKS